MASMASRKARIKMSSRIEYALYPPSLSIGCAGLSEGGALATLVHLLELRTMWPWENRRDSPRSG